MPLLPASGDLDVSVHAEPRRDHLADSNTPLITPPIVPPNRGADGNTSKGTRTNEDIVKGNHESTVKVIHEGVPKGVDAKGNSGTLSRVPISTLLARLPALSRDNCISSALNGSTASSSKSAPAGAVVSRLSARRGLVVAPGAGLTLAGTAADGGDGRSRPSELHQTANGTTTAITTNTNTANVTNTNNAHSANNTNTSNANNTNNNNNAYISNTSKNTTTAMASVQVRNEAASGPTNPYLPTPAARHVRSGGAGADGRHPQGVELLELF